jgi:YidC/Oxa1 family membrane protein insertase
MDKKNTVIGVALIAAAIAFMFWMQQSAPPPPPRPAPAASAPAGTATGDASAAAANTAPTSAPASAVNTAFAAARADSATAKVTTLSNSFIEVHFTDSGGAIRDVALKKRDAKDRLIYPAELNGSTPFIFNELHADPMLAFVDFPGLDRSSRSNVFRNLPRKSSTAPSSTAASKSRAVTPCLRTRATRPIRINCATRRRFATSPTSPPRP